MLGIHNTEDSTTPERQKKVHIREIDSLPEEQSSVREYFGQMDTGVEINHEKVLMLSSSEQAAFSLINLTGEHIRFHQQKGQKSEIIHSLS